ncbi:MAG: hypothetical protein AB7G75_17010 [Candidatus Binatia bacterium]
MIPFKSYTITAIMCVALISFGVAFAAADTVSLTRTSSGSSDSALPADDPWITFCLIYSDPGEDLDECLRLGGVGDASVDPTALDSKALKIPPNELRQTYVRMTNFIQDDTRNLRTGDFGFSARLPVFEQVSACGVHFSSGEHPVSVRCTVDGPCSGAFDPDIVLSVSWDTLVWNDNDSVVEHGAPAGCAVAFNLGQLPAQEEVCAQQIVNEFNQSLSCDASGLSAVLTTAPAGSFIDIYYTPQNTDEMSIPGPLSTGTLTK